MFSPSLEDAVAAGLDADVLRRLWSRIERDIHARVIPGAVTLVLRNGEPVLHWAQGWRDANWCAPMSEDSIFWIASMTKPVCCAAALTLAHERLLDLDAPVALYLPAFADLEAAGAPGERVGRRMTVRDLMRHTSGLTYGQLGDSPVHRMYLEQGVYRFDQTNEQMADKLARLPLLHVPGTTFEYGMSTDVLGRVLEVCTGRPLDQVIAKRITGPLGMADTHFRLPAEALPRLARAQPSENMAMMPPTAREPVWLSGGGGLWSTAADYARFALMLMQDGWHRGIPIIRRTGAEAMLSAQLPEGVRYGSYISTLGSVAPTPAMGQTFGLGVCIRTRERGNPLPGTRGDFTWPGMSGCNFWCDPQRGLVVVQMLQAPSQRFAYRALLREAIYAALR